MNIIILFTKQDLITAIRNGDDSRENSVVVTLDGKIKVIPIEKAQENCDNYAVRHETFGAGNDYVGFEASRDMSHIDCTFDNLDKAWKTHVETGETSVYADGWYEG
ncbi:hypothetical protein RCG23_03330 [Neobacillus sp. PS3-34]|uniref:hypothetical protein n=1 Tax=Neobacillus sp. PS3-34 TaxID=3070678 RepID=UPI0027E0D7E6|nr:hypothetical protein [Neobacillus sp. PS3-34]WML49140.1 hypothetical protein RCG23_03330 [Neobacillus sp. PS3-34]